MTRSTASIAALLTTALVTAVVVGACSGPGASDPTLEKTLWVMGTYRDASDWQLEATGDMKGLMRLIPFDVPGKPLKAKWGPGGARKIPAGRPGAGEPAPLCELC